MLTQALQSTPSALLLAEWQSEVAKLRRLWNSSTSLAALPLASSLPELNLTFVRASARPVAASVPRGFGWGSAWDFISCREAADPLTYIHYSRADRAAPDAQVDRYMKATES